MPEDEDITEVPVRLYNRRRMTPTELGLLITLIGQGIAFVWGAATLKATIQGKLEMTNTSVVGLRDAVVDLKMEMRESRTEINQLTVDVGVLKAKK